MNEFNDLDIYHHLLIDKLYSLMENQRHQDDADPVGGYVALLSCLFVLRIGIN